MDECKPLLGEHPQGDHSVLDAQLASGQGLALVHFLAQLERFLWDRGCMYGLFRGC